MRAAYVAEFNPSDPLAALVVNDRPEPKPDAGWTIVELRAAALNHHDVWSLRGVGLRDEQLPMVLGCDLAGISPEGEAVVVHAVIDGKTLFSEWHQGTMSERVAVPRANLLPKPAELSFEEAACLPTAWLTAYTMLFEKATLRPGDTVLIQGASGGLATALIKLADAAGVRVWVTGRSEEKRSFALDCGADAAFENGARVPERVDAVMDSVGEATLPHSLKCLKRGGVVVVSGGTSGYTASVNVAQLFAMHLRVIGTSMGSAEDLGKLLRFCVESGVRPPIDRVLPLADAHTGFSAMVAGDTRGKIVLVPK
jgi:NADPH:quinone reductase-like Zn-dependent oxidoreductase